VLAAALPLRVELQSGAVRQTVFTTTRDGLVAWKAPFLKDFPPGPIEVTLIDLASGEQDRAVAR
jgi:hypothetical protein